MSEQESWCVRIGPQPGRPGAFDLVEGSGSRCCAVYRGQRHGPFEVLRYAVDGRTAVAFTGFLTNRAAITQRLGADRADEDEASLVHRLYSRLGAGALADLRGGFALVVWDGDRDTFIATHDPVGTHPVFWARSGSAVLFSDSIDTLLDRPEVSRSVNRLALADHIRWRWPDPQETFFEAVKRVPPGNTFTDAAGRSDIRRTWDPAPMPIQWASAEEVEQFDHIFAEAVDRCLDLGTAGISLSGGLDSVSVAAFAAEAAARRGQPAPIALSMRFPDAGVNEEGIQRSVASQLGFKMVMMGLDEAVAPYGVLEATLELAKSWPAPMYNPWLPAYLSLGHKGKQEGASTFVTGGGGDEWLCVSPYLAADLMLRFDVRGLYRLMTGALRSHRMSPWLILKCYLWSYGVRGLGRRALGKIPGALAYRDRRVLTKTTQPWLAPDPALRKAIDARWEPAGVPDNYYLRDLREGLDASLVAQEMEEFFELGRRVQLPVMRPFLDPDLIELLARVPPEVLNRGGRTKALIRQTLDRRFPELAFGQQRKVQAIPTLERVLRTQFDDLWASVGPPKALADLGIVDLVALDASVADIRAQPYASLWRLFMLQSTEVFTRARL